MRAFTLPAAVCWEGVHPAGYFAGELGALAVAGSVLVPGSAVAAGIGPRTTTLRLIVGAALLAELAAALGLLVYLLRFPTYHCG